MKKLSSLLSYAFAISITLTSSAAFAQTPEKLAGWHFSTLTAAPGTPTTITAQTGSLASSSVLYANGTNGASSWTSLSSNPQLTAFGGSTLNDDRATPAADQSLVLANNSANGQSVVFTVSTTGYQDLVLTYATRGTSSGFTSQTWAYSTDGTNFTSLAPFTGTTATTFSVRTVDLSAISSLDNQALVYLRLTVDGAGNASGNNRLDNVLIHATAASTSTPLSATISSQTDVSCNGGTNGSATVTASGGTSSYTYVWAPAGGTSATATGLAAGTYTVTVTDAALATTTATVTISQPAALTTSGSQTDVTCNGGSDATATVNVSGGTAPYTYDWAGNPTGDGTNTISGLTPGAYSVTITDANSCTTTRNYIIFQPAPVPAIATSNSPVVSGTTLLLSATGGVNYTWTGPNSFSSTSQNPQIANATSANAGTYTVTVTNANGCSAIATTSVSVIAPGAMFLTVNQTMPATSTNFTSFASLANYLNNTTITGPVTVDVVIGSGPYVNQRLQLGQIAGSSATNTVTINGNGNALNLCSGDPLNRDMIRLDGTDNITVNGFVLNATCGNGWGVHLMNGNDNVTISNNTINLNATYSIYGANLQGIIASNSWNAPGAEAGELNNVAISGNTITNGYHGIRINGNSATWASNLTITGNTLTNTVAFGIVTSNTNDLEVSENTVSMKNVDPAQDVHSIGIQINKAENGLAVTGNKVANAGKQALFLNYINETSTTRGLVANNMLGGGFRFSAPIALQFNFASYLDVYYNSTNTDFGNGMGVYFSNAASRQLRVVNNSFAYTGTSTGRALQANNANTNFTQLDYNNYYSTGQMAWFNGAYRNSIAALQASVEYGTVAHDANSWSVNPLYISATDLHLQAGSPLAGNALPLAAVTTDYDGNLRSTTAPTIGADELGVGPVRLAPATVMASVYPNPFVSELSLKLENATGNVRVVMVDMMGREVYSNNFTATANPVIIQPAGLAQGIYLLQVTNNGVATQSRVVKQ